MFGEYIDNLSGRYADNRSGYQQMLSDAREGKFSFVAVENAERFGRNDTEALTAIDELNSLGIAVRFADYPDLDPIDPDDRIMVGLSFTLARRESMKLGQRTRGGLHAKLRSGGAIGRAPDGYINCEAKNEDIDKTKAGRYSRWVEQDPEQIQVWRMAWDLLLEDRMTLGEICEELHAKGYTYRTGRAFVKVTKSGKRKPAVNALSRIFRKWFYAGWVVSEKAGIPPKTVRGNWEPLLTTEEFEQGLAILKKRSKNAGRPWRKDYLLRGILYVQKGLREVKLTGSTPNASRPAGGTPYYCLESSNVNIPCQQVDDQINDLLYQIQIAPDLIPVIHEAYTDDIAQKLGHHQPDRQQKLENELRAVDTEEERTLRLFASGKISEKIWDSLWRDWQERRQRIRYALVSVAERQQQHINNLDAALDIITQIGTLYGRLERNSQKLLLREVFERIVVDPDGSIIRVDLQSPFTYLQDISDKVRDKDGGKTKTSPEAGHRSSIVSPGRNDETRVEHFAPSNSLLFQLPQVTFPHKVAFKRFLHNKIQNS